MLGYLAMPFRPKISRARRLMPRQGNIAVPDYLGLWQFGAQPGN